METHDTHLGALNYADCFGDVLGASGECQSKMACKELHRRT